MGTPKGRVFPATAAKIKFLKDLAAFSETNDCIMWPFQKRKTGYGYISFRCKTDYPHRVICEMAHGTPFHGAHAAHSCGNKACVNPRHLRWASRSENEHDKISHGRSNRGARNGMAKIHAADVREIRRRAANGLSSQSIASEFGLGLRTVEQIKAKQRWGWLDD